MKSIRRGLAVLLAVLLIVPAMPVWAEEVSLPNPEETIADGGAAGVDEAEPETRNQEAAGVGGEAAPEGNGSGETKGNGEAAPGTGGEAETGAGNNAVPGTGDKAETGAGSEATPGTGDEAEADAGNEAVPGIGDKEEADAGNNAVPGTGDEAETGAGNEAAPGTVNGSEAGAGNNAAPETGDKAETDTGSEAVPGTGDKAEIVPGSEPVPGNVDKSEAFPESGNTVPVSTDQVQYNTGNHVFTIGSPAAGEADDYFAEDGSYIINIPEVNPFFPYEVQFTYEGEAVNAWFMTPEDSVKIGEHVFYVSAYFDGTAVTQMSLDVAGNTVIVYPEEKEFSNDGDGTMPASLLPLEEKSLKVDLRAYTPAELTMISVNAVLQGENVLTDTDKIMWRQSNYSDDGDYTISTYGSLINLSNNTYSSSVKTLEMIVGEPDQLAGDNIRYIVSASITPSKQWLVRKAYTQDAFGNRKEVSVLSGSNNQYYDYRDTNRYLYTYISAGELGQETQVYLGLSVNQELFAEPQYAGMKVYAGQFATAEEAAAGTDITEMILAADMTQQNAGYLCPASGSQWITIVTFDAVGNVTGCLPFRLSVTPRGNSMSYYSLFQRVDGNRTYVVNSIYSRTVDGCVYRTYKLYEGFAANGTYYQIFEYKDENNNSNKDAVTGAFVGQYETIAAAQAAGAEDIKDVLFNSDYETGGYGADYSQGVYFSIFVGADNTPEQEIYHYCIATEESDIPQSGSSVGSGTSLTFSGLADASGKRIPSYVVDSHMDSYGEYNYLTILVEKDADLTNLAPTFWNSSGMKLYTAGSTTPEVSGKSLHDFSAGYIQYTAAAEDGSSSKNYWLQVVKAVEGSNGIYINSFADESAGTYAEGGVIYSKREMMLDGYHDYVHDIWLANMGTEAVPALAVELASDTVELDQYWTLSGNYDLSGFSTVVETTPHGELPNLAKIRIRAKEGVEKGTDIVGQLIIKSGEIPLIVLTLTGTVGDPCITTEELPQAVKYVPYGTMIQNNNKYSWNQVTYSLMSGSLPAGMEVKPNGEVYGVPAESGEFTFTVRMRNSYSGFSDSTRSYTLSVIENTSENVEAATDAGYDLNQRIQDVYLHNEDSHTMISQGVFDEFVDLYLDGVKLIRGTDYDAESGSTRITILAQTLTRGGNGTHTLGVEFRTQDTDTLKRAAQNYEVRETDDDDDDNENNDNGSSGDDNDGGSDNGDDNNGSTDGVGNNGGIDMGAGAVGYDANAQDAGTSYTIEAGDSLWKIAKKFYGSGSYWKKVYDDNRAVLKNGNQIYAGQKIMIYMGQKGTAASDAAGQNNTAASGTGKKTYTVRAGDTLWKIAAEVYGKGWHWKKIYDANVEKITAPEKLHVGQVLMISD